MSNQPHVVTEEITLTVHPMDTWRTALDALIACAPGDETAIAWHLIDASSQLPVNRGAVDQLHEAPANGPLRIRDQAMVEPFLNRRVTNRLTVVVNGTNYDVSDLSGVLVGDVIRVDLDNMPPVLSRDWGFARPQPLEGGYQSLRAPGLCHGRSSSAVGQPDSASAPLQQGAAALSRQSANESSPAATGYSARPVYSATHPAQETPPEGHQGVPAEPQHPDHS